MCRSPLNLVLLLCASLAAAAPPKPAGPPAAQAPDSMLHWTGVNGNVVFAKFVKLGDDGVVLQLKDGPERSVPFAWFSPQSLILAKQQAEKQGDQAITLVRNQCFKRIRNGEFTMGSPITETGRDNQQDVKKVLNQPNPIVVAQQEPEHKVKITEDFWLKQTEVTWAEWNAVLKLAVGLGYTDLSAGRNGYDGKTDTHPVTEITWWDAIKWCNAKSQIENKTAAYYTSPDFNPANILMTGTPMPHVMWNASGYRLPTEAEWEFACRAGKGTGRPPFPSGKISHPGIAPLDLELNEVAWYAGNSAGNTHPVATKQSNRFGLFDMHGNVAEWCWDWGGMLPLADTRDPRGADAISYRTFRGGTWADPARCCRAAYRGTYSPLAPSSSLTGFRPACGSDPLTDEPAGRNRPRTSNKRGSPVP